jgi:hypothetical protein
MKIAVAAGQRQIADFVAPTMLFRHDVFDVVKELTVPLLCRQCSQRAAARSRTSRRFSASIAIESE